MKKTQLVPVAELAHTHQLGELRQYDASIPFWRNWLTYEIIGSSVFLMFFGLLSLAGGIVGFLVIFIPIFGAGLFLLIIWVRNYPSSGSGGGIYLYANGFIQVTRRRQDVARWEQVVRFGGPRGYRIRLNNGAVIGIGVGYIRIKSLQALGAALRESTRPEQH